LTGSLEPSDDEISRTDAGLSGSSLKRFVFWSAEPGNRNAEGFLFLEVALFDKLIEGREAQAAESWRVSRSC
jgi:hypothetical protein